ncbi:MULTISPECIES: Uma2 family endonuclease [unclassified Coleofasciculus]|uniref:Uma2 family endonuclease n=1 Tax=unclassified Coleofasciculus TaxID=2692782 RepID=UPI00187E007F|nr:MULTISPECIES: Uma2 family endonuclease [unclassified Coleofasciculus]MBE9128363.1 Uma2 family endonuclease [Coleofasciculus sp. LEGE 07081]MBE9151419.1 Uma2 family endonuclease [Coleofasciculus sp. LEGE 07092]
MHLTITNDRIDLPPGGEVILRHQTWLDYEKLLESRQDKAAIKIYFDVETQEIRIMAPLPGHGKKSDTLSDLVKALLRHQGQDWDSFDPITLKRFEQAGLEPDSCFYIQNRQAILGKERIDLEIDPPPDLALEIDLTSSTKPEDYQGIGVPELWIYRRKVLYLYLFDGQQYQQSPNSLTFPGIPVKQLIPNYVERAWEAGSSIALREFENKLREQQ